MIGKYLLPFAAAVCLFAGPADLQRAEDLYSHTNYKESLNLLLASPPVSAAQWELIGKDWFMLGEFKKAAGAFQKAFDLAPEDSNYALWLGRAFGRRAEIAGPLLAAPNALKARRYFEKAVQLDPSNQEALNDLFDYYLQAPGILGGGKEKAAAVADRIAKLNPAEYHSARAQLAGLDNQYDAAEQQLRLAWQLAPREVGRIIDLAKYLAKRGRYQESEAAFQEAGQVAPGDPKLLFARASVYIETKRKLDEARKLLRKYLRSNLTPDDPAREEAQRLLKEAGDSGA